MSLQLCGDSCCVNMANMALGALPHLAPTCEVVIRIYSRRGGRGLTADQQLEAALRSLREQRYEVDIYIRGTWRRSGGYWKPMTVTERHLDGWRLINGQLEAKSAEHVGEWYPCPTRKPWPEIVVRGVRSGE